MVHIDCSDWKKSKTVTEVAHVNGVDRDHTSDLKSGHKLEVMVRKREQDLNVNRLRSRAVSFRYNVARYAGRIRLELIPREV